MIGIKSIASYVPDDFIDNFVQAQKFDENEDFITKKIGATKLPRKKKEQETSDIAQLAVEALLDKEADLKLEDVDALVVVTQNPDGAGLPHTSAILQNKLGLPTTVAAFDVSLGCSGYVYGLNVLKGFLEASGLQNGILVTCDPYSKVINPEDRVTTLLFGDAATATWLGTDPIFNIGASSYGTDGSGAKYLEVSDDVLSMNGRQIFTFAATKVEPQIKETIVKQGVSAEDIDLFCIHQGSAAIIEAISRRFKGLEDRFVNEMSHVGNTVSSTIPLLLEQRITNTDLNKILICGFGVGLSMATSIITRQH